MQPTHNTINWQYIHMPMHMYEMTVSNFQATNLEKPSPKTFQLLAQLRLKPQTFHTAVNEALQPLHHGACH